MGNYVFTFRGPKGRNPSAEDEARWPEWFASIGSQITDFGNRVGDSRTVGADADQDTELAGYIVISADSLDDAAAVAGTCPMLKQGGYLEVGEIVPGV